jgi:hypothetical protein
MNWPQQGHRLLALVVIASSVCSPAEAAAADDRATFLTELFMKGCVPNMGNPDGVRAWATTNHLTQLESPSAVQIFVGPDDKGAAWAVPTQYGNFALSIRGTTRACAVWARLADAAEVESHFKALIEGTKRPGVRVRTDKDETQDTPNGRIRGLVYNIVALGAPSGYEFTILTVDSTNASFQASLQVAKAAAD